MTTIQFSPEVPLWLLIGFAVVGLALAGLAAWHGGRGGLARALGVLLLAFAAAGPMIVRETRLPKPDIAVVVADRSESQTIGERGQRTAAAAAELRQRLSELPNLELREAALEPDPKGDGTRLVGAAERALADVPRDRLAGVVLLTDGRVHDVESASRLGGPVHVLLSGEHDEKDRRIVLEAAPEYGISGSSARVAFRIEDRPGQEAFAEVTVRLDGEILESRRLAVGRRHEVEIPLRRPGEAVVEIGVAALSGEITERNNRVVAHIQSVRDRLRVLLVSGRPHGGERVWRNLLKSDPSVDLIHFTILRTMASQDPTPTNELSLIFFPVQELFEEKLDEFDLIVFDRYQLRDIVSNSYLENVRRYVRKGGALLLAVGPEFAGYESLYNSALGEIIPAAPTGGVEETGFYPRVTDLGRRHPVTTAIAGPRQGPPPWGRWFRQVDVRGNTGETLMEGVGGQPLLITSRVDEGRVALLASDHVWLWSRGLEGGGPHGEFMRRLVHWLLKEPELEEEALRASVVNGRLAVERRSLSEQPAQVEVVAPSGARETVTVTPAANGVGRVELSLGETGLYRIGDGRRQAFAAVGPANPQEWADPRTTPEVLAPAVQAAGGGINWIVDGLPGLRRVDADRDVAGPGWIGFKRNDRYVVTGLSRLPLAPGLLASGLILMVMGAGWWREGR